MENNKNGYVGGFVENQGNASYTGGVISKNEGIQENAGSYAGGIVLDKEGLNGNVGKFVSGKQEAGVQDGFIGGYIGQEGNIDGYVGKEENIGINQIQNVEKSGLPAKVGLWSKVKSFLFQEIDLNKEIVVKLSPKEEKVLTEVHDFLFQEVSFKGIKDFLFQDITFGKKKKQ